MSDGIKIIKIIIKNIILIIVVFIACIIVNIVITYTSMEKIPEEKILHKESFMEACIGTEEDKEYCSYVYDYLIDKYGREGFIDIILEWHETNKVPPEVNDAIEECISEKR